MIKLSVVKLITIGLICAVLGGIAMFNGMAADISGNTVLSSKMQFWSGLSLGIGLACLAPVTIAVFKRNL